MTNIEHLSVEETQKKSAPPVQPAGPQGTTIAGGTVAMSPGAVLAAGALAGNSAVASQMQPAENEAGGAGPAGPAPSELRPLSTPASAAGFQLIGQTTWAKLKQACTRFNTGLSAPKTPTAARSMQAALAAIEKLAEDWSFGHRTDKGESHEVKKREIGRLRLEIAANRSFLADHLETMTRHGEKGAWDDASFMPAYSGEAYVSGDMAKGAWERWLTVPALASIFRYYVAKEQFQDEVLNAWDDLRRWKKGSRTGASAKAIYTKYSMQASDVLNITGEGAGGQEAIAAARRAVTGLEDGATAPVGVFGALDKSLDYTLWQMFINLTKTPRFAKITKAPVAPS